MSEHRLIVLINENTPYPLYERSFVHHSPLNGELILLLFMQ